LQLCVETEPQGKNRKQLDIQGRHRKQELKRQKKNLIQCCGRKSCINVVLKKKPNATKSTHSAKIGSKQMLTKDPVFKKVTPEKLEQQKTAAYEPEDTSEEIGSSLKESVEVLETVRSSEKSLVPETTAKTEIASEVKSHVFSTTSSTHLSEVKLGESKNAFPETTSAAPQSTSSSSELTRSLSATSQSSTTTSTLSSSSISASTTKPTITLSQGNF